MLGDAIKRARIEKSLTQMELSENILKIYRIPNSSGMISRYEHASKPVTSGQMAIPLLFALCDFLQLDLNNIAKQEMKLLKERPGRIPFQHQQK